MAQPRATRRPFGEEVRELIAESDMSLRGLAAKVGVDPGFLVRVLQGKQPPSQKLLMGVAEAFDLPSDYFVEARRETLTGLLSHNRVLVDVFYDQVAPARVVDTEAPAGMAHPGSRESQDDRLKLLSSTDVNDPRLLQFAAAVLVRYRTDKEFRNAVDAELPEIEKLAREIMAARLVSAPRRHGLS